MSENDEVSFDTKENNDENIPADQRSIRVTIRSNLDPIVIEIAGDDNVDFIKQNILIELEKRGKPQKASDLILIKDDEVLDNGAEEIHFLTNGEAELNLELKFPHRLKRQRLSDETNEIRKRNAINSRTRLQNCVLLQKNFQACIDSCQINGDPRDRKIIDNNELENKEEPTGRDLGYMVRDMASSIRTWSYQLDQMSKLLTKSQENPDDCIDSYENASRLIQNNMDAARYMSHQLNHFTQFVVPLGEDPPRKLSVLPDVIKDSLKSDINPSNS